MPGAAALIIRSATQVTDEVLAAGSDLVMVGRAGIGLDNVDVAAATKRGVMVVNAPRQRAVCSRTHRWPCPVALAERSSGMRCRCDGADGNAASGTAWNWPTKPWA